MPLYGILLSLLTAFFWAASPILMERAISSTAISTAVINPIRSIAYVVASFVAMWIFTNGNIPVVSSYNALICILSSVFFNYIIGDVFFYISIKKAGLTVPMAITSAHPILIPFTSWILLREQLTYQIFFCVILVVTGLLFLHFASPTVMDKRNEDSVVFNRKEQRKGFLYAIAAGCAWAIGAPITKMAMIISEFGAIELTFYRAIGLLLIVWIMRVAGGIFGKTKPASLRTVPLRAWGYLMLAGLVGLVAGSIAYSTCLQLMPVAIVTAVTSISPVITALFGKYFLHERLTRWQYFGIGLIFIGSISASL